LKTSLIYEGAVPELEAEEGPDAMGMVSLLAVVLVQQSLYMILGEYIPLE
jgi:hypothetical protein